MADDIRERTLSAFGKRNPLDLPRLAQSDAIQEFQCGQHLAIVRIRDLLELQDEDFVIAVDTNWRASANRDRDADYVSCTEAHGRESFYRRVLLEACGEELDADQIDGEWMGFLRIRGGAMARLRGHVDRLLAQPAGRQMKLHHLLDAMVKSGEQLRVVYTTGHWLDVDTVDDVVSAGRFG